MQSEVVDTDRERTAPTRSPSQGAAGIGRLAPHRRTFFFIVVGGAATLVHFATVTLLVHWIALPPLGVNVLGWLCALGVSFTGHYRLTFSDHAASMVHSAPRFFLISACGFAINESTYAIALRFTRLNYGVLLAIILMAVAGLTYLTSRYWAFSGTKLRHRARVA